jgi:hypothetical protein
MGTKNTRRTQDHRSTAWTVIGDAAQGGWGPTVRLGLLLAIISTCGVAGGSIVADGGMRLIEKTESIISQ